MEKLGEQIQRLMDLQEKKNQTTVGSDTGMKSQANMNTATTMTSTSYKCERCKDREWLICRDEKGNEYAVECECRRQRNFERSLKRARIPNFHRDKTFKNFKTDDKNKSTKDKCKEYTMQSISTGRLANSLVLCGQVGSGKTHLAMAIINNLVKHRFNAKYIDYRSFITHIKQNITNGELYQKEMGELIGAEVLVIDDLFKGRITESDVNIMYEIVNTRYANGSHMIITTEKNSSELLEIDEAIASRLIEMAKGFVIKSDGENKRLK